MSGSAGAYVAQVDRVLAAGQSVFAAPVSAPPVTATGGPAMSTTPAASGLSLGVDTVGDRYRGDWRALAGLDQDVDGQRGAARDGREQSSAAATEVRRTARAQAAAIAPSARSPEGARLLVTRMDERLDAMQRQLTTAKAQQRLLAIRLRQLAAGYRLTAPPLPGRPTPYALASPKALTPSRFPNLPPRALPASTATKPSLGAPHLTRDSTPRQVAARILWEAHRRGYSRDQAIAILSTAMRESALNPRALSPNRLWESIFQQDASYPDRRDPNGAIAGFFDRLAMKGGPQSPDIWKAIFWLQQRPGEPSAEAAYAHGRRAYLAEIRGPLRQATQLYTQLIG